MCTLPARVCFHCPNSAAVKLILGFSYHDGLGSCQSFSEYLRAFPYSEKTYESNYKFKNGLEFWEAMTADPVKAKRFPLAMQGIASCMFHPTACILSPMLT